MLAGGPDLDLGVHLRADPTVEARVPAAVLDLDVVEGVLPVLPQPVLVQAGVEVVPGQHLVLLTLASGEPGDVDRLVRQGDLGTPHPAFIAEVLAPAVEPGTVTPGRLDDLADTAVTAGQQSFDDAGFAIVIAETDGRGVPPVAPDRVAQLLQPRVGLRCAELGAPLERGVPFGDEPTDGDGAPDVTLTGDPSPGLDHPLGEVGDLEHVIIGLGGQTAHEVELHLTPAGRVGRGDGVDQVVLADHLVDDLADALGATLGSERQAGTASAPGQLVGQVNVEGVDTGRRQRQSGLSAFVAISKALGDLGDL